MMDSDGSDEEFRQIESIAERRHCQIGKKTLDIQTFANKKREFNRHKFKKRIPCRERHVVRVTRAEGVCSRSRCCRTAFTNVLASLVPTSSLNAYWQFLGGGGLPHLLAASRTVFNPRSTTADDKGQIVRSPDALRLSLSVIVIAKSLPLRSASASGNIPSPPLTPAQRCVTTKQMTDNMIELDFATAPWLWSVCPLFLPSLRHVVVLACTSTNSHFCANFRDRNRSAGSVHLHA